MSTISIETVETARKTAAAAQDVTEAFQAGVDEAREAYVNDSKTDTWSEYIHALSQYQAAARRATAARLMADAVAHAYHLEQAWERCKALPLAPIATPAHGRIYGISVVEANGMGHIEAEDAAR